MTERKAINIPPVPYVNEAYVPPAEKEFKTEDDYLAMYPGEAEHPLQYIFRAVPRGKGRPPMNWDHTEQKLLAIHLERCGVVVDPDLVTVQYRMPDHGPAVSFNPGTWVDARIDLGEQDMDGTIDLTGVPPEQLAAIKAAARREEIRQARMAEADPIVTPEGEIIPWDTLTGTAHVQVVKTEEGGTL